MMNRRCLLATGLLSLLLLASAVLSYMLFRQGREYYQDLEGVRLDPLGLSHYSIEPEQRKAASSDRQLVVFFGDSRAADWPAPALDRFEFVNRGISSETSVQAVLRFDYHIRPLLPDVIVVQVGINDLKAIPVLPGQKDAIVANCRENIRQIVEQALGLGAKVVLTTVFPTGPAPIERRLFWSDDVAGAVEQVNTAIRALAGDQVLVFDSYAILVGPDGSLKSEYGRDLLHLSAAGYDRLNEALVPALVEFAGK